MLSSTQHELLVNGRLVVLHGCLVAARGHACVGETRAILEAVSPAQSYDIQLMLFVLPYVLLGAITASSGDGRSRRSAPAAAPEGGIVPDGQAAQAAILEEVAAVATLCCGGAGLEAVTPPTAQPREALHLQAILGALDTLKRCGPPPPAERGFAAACWP